MTKRILIVGGVAGGATAAAHARRLAEDAEIVVFERGPYVSFANCGLPYYVGGEIRKRDQLLLQTPQSLRGRFNLDVRVKTEVISIDRNNREICVRDLESGSQTMEHYDELVLSTGASPLTPPIPGIKSRGHFTVRNVPDVDAIDEWLRQSRARNAVVVGGGYIGLEMTEQLHQRGLTVTLVEALPQVMAPIDIEMAGWLHQELRSQGVTLYLEDGVKQFEPPSGNESARASVVVLNSGRRVPADIVILGLGVRPETSLARDAGLEIGERGGIRVDENLRTSDPRIWALGDAIEVRDWVTGAWVLVPLAGPANRQGRIVAENIFGNAMKYGGTCGTAILRLFRISAACTGASERVLKAAGFCYDAVHLHPWSHADYYPGSRRLTMKILFDPDTGQLLGAQVIGREGVDKRIDVLATALKAQMTVNDLENLELAYAPPYGSAKDPVNLAGMVARHVVNGEVLNAQWHEITERNTEQSVLMDVRDRSEWESGGHIPNAIHIPLPELRGRIKELSKDKEIIVYCQTGQRSYFAARLLMQNGFKVRNLTGAYRTWKMAQPSG